jgi:hypothetical protein
VVVTGAAFCFAIKILLTQDISVKKWNKVTRPYSTGETVKSYGPTGWEF